MTKAEDQAPGAPARRYHHGDLRAALLAAAEAALEREGAEAVSFRAIARAVGVSQTAPYNHFENRSALLAVLVEHGFADLVGSQAAAVAQSSDPGVQIETAGLDYLAFAKARPQLYRLMFGVGLPDWHARPRLAAAKFDAIQPLRSALAALGRMGGRDEAWVDASAVAAWAIVHGLAMLRLDHAFVHIGGAMPEDGLERHALTALVKGLA